MRPLAPDLPRHLSALFIASAILGGCQSDNTLSKLDADDAFFQAEAGEVDVLLVVDNSGSMQPYQEKLSTNFENFLEYFTGYVDYRIGVVTSTIENPPAQGACTQAQIDAIPDGGALVGGTWISDEDADGAERFAELVQVGTCGAGYEMGLETALLALTPPMSADANAGFLREEAYLSIIFVSDEEDSSPGTTNEYINAFRDLKGVTARDVFNASALVVTNESDCTDEQLDAGASQNIRMVDVADQTNGVVGSICSGDFATIVTELSLASSRLTDTFYLSQTPDAGSLIVGVDEEEVDCSDGMWEYTRVEGRPAIVFSRDQLPPPGARITASYDYGD
ncbi:MAG TPA: hypothetical protein DFR83_02830, partial [Deltaproteobacteria bacterium]|nr:hypothetical protein [Deltaproteobacteria bacterium]